MIPSPALCTRLSELPPAKSDRRAGDAVAVLGHYSTPSLCLSLWGLGVGGAWRPPALFVLVQSIPVKGGEEVGGPVGAPVSRCLTLVMVGPMRDETLERACPSHTAHPLPTLLPQFSLHTLLGSSCSSITVPAAPGRAPAPPALPSAVGNAGCPAPEGRCPEVSSPSH